MPKAKIKKKKLPDAPPPTKPIRVEDPREIERAKRIREGRSINFDKDNKTFSPFWDDARLSKMRRMWEEGYLVKDIAREIGCVNVKQCHNRIGKEIEAGRLVVRKNAISQEDIDGIEMRYRAGMACKEIARDTKISMTTVYKVIKHIRRKEKK
jgi:DNA-binding CsgD family transcriptional regulator